MKTYEQFVTSDKTMSARTWLTSNELEVAATSLAEKITASGAVILGANALPESTNLDGDVLPETISFFVWNGYLNLNATGSIYLKANWTHSFWFVKDETKEIVFKPEATGLLRDIVANQKARLSN